MKVTILAVGRGRDAEVEGLVDRYAKRCGWPMRVVEVTAKRPNRDLEAEALLRRAPEGAKLVALDERGRDLSSEDLAQRLAAWRDESVAEACFCVGGADGHGAALLERADLKLAFGRATWPHLLVRALIAEQVYRAWTIASGHPYHRG